MHSTFAASRLVRQLGAWTPVERDAGAMISDRSTPEQVDTMLKQQTVRWEQALKKIKIDKE